ncbi:MAG: ECF transporter S component [Solirubrobacterales bacterium]|nr:ECF transporter S component [Solirubrobacterales bacterium]
MSWQVGSVALLMVALGAGMLWYERSRPPSQIVALVAVLAALAVAGRIVLAPIPNVVATTDIVIIAGFVLGPAPGFAVGALGGLVSNFWLGQGIWTPWQMVAWGMCGVAGGVLWKMTGGRVNRWGMAAFCGLAGILFGAWMNLETMVSFGGEMSLDRYLALEVRAIPFDIAHMTGNVVFALAAGPAMVAALVRFRERFEWSQVAGQATRVGGVTMIALAALLFAVAGGAPQKAEAAYKSQADAAVDWLKLQQNDDGGFPSTPDGSSSINITARSMFALAAAGVNPLDVKNVRTPWGYLVDNRGDLSKASDIALVTLALKTVGKNPKDFEGRNLIEALRARRGNGSFGNDVNVTAFAILAFRSAKAKKDAKFSAKWLRSAQNDNGGWGIGSGTKSDPDSTGAALMALGNGKPARKALQYLNKAQWSSGGFGTNGLPANSQSTGLVIQGLVATGRGMNYLKKNGNSSSDYLLARQQDDGSIWYSKDSDATRVWVTADAATALAGKALPVSAPPREQKPDDNEETNNGGVSPTPPPSSTPNTTTPLPPASLVDPTDSYNNNGSGNTNTNKGNSGNGNTNKGNSGNNGNNYDPGDTPSLGEAPADPTVPLVPVAPSDAVLAASEAGPQPSPILAILIALGVGGGLCGGTILLARRFRW